MHIVVPLIVALPLFSALATLAFGGGRRRRVSRISVLFLTITWILACVLLWWAIEGSGNRGTISLFGWFAFQSDPLGALMVWVIAGISLIVHLYSRRYMAEEAGYSRFFVLLNLMTSALLAMVLANDLILLVVVWHLIGMLLYLLLGIDLSSREAHGYSVWTFITFRLGDLPMVLAAVLLFDAYGTWSMTEIFTSISADPLEEQILGISLTKVVALLIALAAFARSAQFVTHLWLPYTMDGPTPVSALMHAGIVNAGGFLINRFAGVFVYSSEVLHLMFLVGLATAVIGSTLMLTQHDIKKSLGYSTMGQMGFMIMECGVGAFSLAIYHLIAHGVFKGTLFLGAGGVIGAARRDDGVPAEDLYTFLVERQIVRQRRPWLAMALLTIVVPLIILFFAHYMVEQAYFEKQGAVVLLFFGWMTGAQLLFATHHMRAEKPLRLFVTILISFAVVVLGYVLVAYAFDEFLYPDHEFRAQIYASAGVKLIYFDFFVVFMTIIFVLGWVFAFFSERRRLMDRERIAALRRVFYRIAVRELYAGDVMAWVSRVLVNGARDVNARLGRR